MKNSLKIVAISPLQTAKDGRQFFTATFSPGFGQLNAKRNMWEQFKKDPATSLPVEPKVKYWERGSYAEAKSLLESGESIEGRKVTHKVEKYTLGSGETAREVDTFSTVVFADENEVTVFANANHNIIDQESGEILGKKSATLASNKPAMAEVPVVE